MSSEIANTLFPPPPPYYKAYTADDVIADSSAEEQSLQPPRVDWIDEEAKWMCFGEALTTAPRIPTPAEIGLPPLTNPSDSPQESLPPLLHSFLHTMLLLLDTLTNTARNPGELEQKGWAHEGDQYIQHLTNIAATMMVEANQVRSVQAEATLVLLMEKQLQERRAQTAALKSKCEHLSSTLRALRP
ncbi:mediator of RNA polymerase II transcription subunit 7 [Dioszegia hungarica]|uniref:Mediator of RNA polymerase II transcription subunit 7 n=1 Tax=Dioszegia hungarica TaxID=4972 RepID=A0AA38HFN8_9TREE|nr:mediator of RNA polymerase II transcription subunit 7 [Dioszegia hungarica]KAI9638216.1 mediator of RNA polymerase II transcription subunit 7 [Dioszegia hungarica]